NIARLEAAEGQWHASRNVGGRKSGCKICGIYYQDATSNEATGNNQVPTYLPAGVQSQTEAAERGRRKIETINLRWLCGIGSGCIQGDPSTETDTTRLAGEGKVVDDNDASVHVGNIVRGRCLDSLFPEEDAPTIREINDEIRGRGTRNG